MPKNTGVAAKSSVRKAKPMLGKRRSQPEDPVVKSKEVKAEEVKLEEANALEQTSVTQPDMSTLPQPVYHPTNSKRPKRVCIHCLGSFVPNKDGSDRAHQCIKAAADNWLFRF
jgi:hypothetical protein